MDIRISPDVVLARERGNPRKGIIAFLSLTVAFLTVIMLINPATTQEYEPVCGLEEHEHSEACIEVVQKTICPLEECEGHVHGEACYAVQPVLVCTIPEGTVHEHTEDCIAWEETCVCGLEDDPEHVHTDECYVKTPVFVCQPEEGAGHVHNEFCTMEETVYTCGLTAHVHTDECFPKLTGDPHADVEIDLDWESTFCNVELTGVWADDLVAIARSQIGYAESERNFVTDEYNVRHGYTRYGDWNGTRYSGWNGLYVMFCLHYAGVWNVPTDPVPSNWMNSAKTQGFWMEKDGLPARGDLAFFDDNADGLADRVAIVTEIREDGFDMISGGTGKPVEEETVLFDSDKLTGYLVLPQNPDYVTLEAQTSANPAEETIPEAPVPLADPNATVTLYAETEDGVKATLNGVAGAFPYPAEELTLMIRDADEYAGQADVTGAAESEGAKPLGVRWLDISVWHEETVPEDPIPAEAAEKQLVKITPAGPVEITVEGLDESGSIWVYRMGREGTAERLEAEADETQHGRVKVLTGLN